MSSEPLRRIDAGPDPRPAAPPACRAEPGCITCLDEGIPMRVVELGPDEGLAVCADERGRRSEVMVGLVDEVSRGDLLLVHAGTALVRLMPDAGSAG